MGDRCARLRANLESFVEGGPLSVCWQPFQGRRHHQVGRLDPVEDGIWDLRSVDPSPGLRIFFALAEKDVMIALICRPRSISVPWLRWPPLGARESKKWKLAISECKRQWRMLLPAHLPLVTEMPNDSISKSVVD